VGAVLRRLFFGLGVLLGVVSPQLAPELTARPYRAGSEILVNAEVVGAYGETALELARAGNRVAVRVEARAGEAAGEVAVGYLRFDAAAATWAVAPLGGAARAGAGQEKRVPGLEAAILLASRAWALRAGPASALEGGGELRVRARVGLIDASGAWHDAALLWGYAEPEFRIGYSGPAEVPY